MTKDEKRLRKVKAKIYAVIDSSPDDPIWGDDEFFNGRWIALIDEMCDLEEKIWSAR